MDVFMSAMELGVMKGLNRLEKMDGLDPQGCYLLFDRPAFTLCNKGQTNKT